MHNLCIPSNNKSSIKINTNLSKLQNNFIKYINKDSNYTIKCFIEAIIKNSTDEAKVYISKNYIDKIDLIQLKDEVLKNKKISHLLVKGKFLNIPKNCKVDTMLILDKEHCKSRFIHIYMLHEPDSFANWKIYEIEEENI